MNISGSVTCLKTLNLNCFYSKCLEGGNRKRVTAEKWKRRTHKKKRRVSLGEFTCICKLLTEPFLVSFYVLFNLINVYSNKSYFSFNQLYLIVIIKGMKPKKQRTMFVKYRNIILLTKIINLTQKSYRVKKIKKKLSRAASVK